MRRSDYMYEVYLDSYNKKLADIRSVISSCTINLQYCANKLREFDNYLIDNGTSANAIISKIRSNVFYIKDIPSLQLDLPKDIKATLIMYIKMYILNSSRLNNQRFALRSMKYFETPREVFKRALYVFNYNMIKEVIKGSKFRLGRGYGSISVIEKHRTYYLPNTTVIKAIDWNESKLNKARLIAEGITPYNSKTAPDGKKWFMYHNEPYVYWFKWTARNTTKYVTGLQFKPLAYVRISKEERVKLENSVKTVDEALDITVFGPIEKLQLVKKKFPKHMLIFRKS